MTRDCDSGGARGLVTDPGSHRAITGIRLI